MLVTLGVIGVVAAITIPGLINTYKAHQLKSKFLKSYSVIQQVFKQMEADDVSTDPSSYIDGHLGDKFYQVFMKYLTGITDCGVYVTNATAKEGCYTYNNEYVTLSGGQFYNHWFDEGQFLLPDGTIIMFEYWVIAEALFITVDINGIKGKPNRWGYDLFTFEFLNGELRTMGDKGTFYTNLDTYCNPENNHRYSGIACAHKAKTDSDYFKTLR